MSFVHSASPASAFQTAIPGSWPQEHHGIWPQHHRRPEHQQHHYEQNHHYYPVQHHPHSNTANLYGWPSAHVACESDNQQIADAANSYTHEIPRIQITAAPPIATPSPPPQHQKPHSDDYLTVKHPNPHTGVMSPSAIDPRPTLQQQHQQRPGKTQIKTQTQRQTPTPVPFQTPRDADEALRLSENLSRSFQWRTGYLEGTEGERWPSNGWWAERGRDDKAEIDPRRVHQHDVSRGGPRHTTPYQNGNERQGNVTREAGVARRKPYGSLEASRIARSTGARAAINKSPSNTNHVQTSQMTCAPPQQAPIESTTARAAINKALGKTNQIQTSPITCAPPQQVPVESTRDLPGALRITPPPSPPRHTATTTKAGTDSLTTWTASETRRVYELDAGPPTPRPEAQTQRQTKSARACAVPTAKPVPVVPRPLQREPTIARKAVAQTSKPLPSVPLVPDHDPRAAERTTGKVEAAAARAQVQMDMRTQTRPRADAQTRAAQQQQQQQPPQPQPETYAQRYARIRTRLRGTGVQRLVPVAIPSQAPAAAPTVQPASLPTAAAQATKREATTVPQAAAVEAPTKQQPPPRPPVRITVQPRRTQPASVEVPSLFLAGVETLTRFLTDVVDGLLKGERARWESLKDSVVLLAKVAVVVYVVVGVFLMMDAVGRTVWALSWPVRIWWGGVRWAAGLVRGSGWG